MGATVGPGAAAAARPPAMVIEAKRTTRGQWISFRKVDLGFLAKASDVFMKFINSSLKFLFAFIFVVTVPGVQVSMEKPTDMGKTVNLSCP